MGNEISTESISEENFKSFEQNPKNLKAFQNISPTMMEYFEKNKKNNNFNKNNSEDLNKIYIISDLDKDPEKIALKHSEGDIPFFYQNDDFNKDVSGHLMNLDFSDIDEINEDYLFNNISSNNSSRNNSNQVNSKMVSQNMVCNNGQCKLRTKECINGQCRFKDETFDIKRNKPINLSDDTNDKNTSFKKFIQKYNQPFDSYDEKTEQNKDTQTDDKTMNLHLNNQLNNQLLKTKELTPIKEEYIKPIKPKPIESKYFQDSETFDEEYDHKGTYYDNNYPDNSLSSISDVFWKKSVF